jgi:hypothetical protein
LKTGATTNLDLSGATVGENFKVQWYDPRNGGPLQDGSVTQVTGGGTVSLGQPPSDAGEDWAILVTAESFVPGALVDDIFLVDADNDSDIRPLTDGTVINVNTLDSVNLNIRATTQGAVGSIGFELSGATTHSQAETVAPYALFGDESGDFEPGALNVGQHTLVVTPYSEPGLGGTAGSPITVNFVVSDSNTNSPPTGSVTISGALIQGQSLTASDDLGDADGLGTISYQWQRDGVNVSGATSSNYVLGSSDVGSLISVVASYTDGGGNLEQVSSSLGQSAAYTFNARNDFSGLDSGQVDYYTDIGNDALAINAAIVANRDGFARASHSFTGQSGVYPVRITTLTEEDGESAYRLLVNGRVVGTYQNPRIGSGSVLDLQPNHYVWNDIVLNAGDTISIESNADTNGEIPEGDGTAWARGRWRTLELFAGVGPVAADNSDPSINGLFLVNADNDADLIPLVNGTVFNMASIGTSNLNVRATTSKPVGSVGFELTGPTTRSQSETIAPYALFGDASGDFRPGAFEVGQHTLVVTPYSSGGLGGTAFNATTITFEVVDHSLDFGDAPSSYGTLLANDGARHLAVGPQLGASRDSESDGVPSVAANGDGGDEDGVMFGAIGAGSPGAAVNIELSGASQGYVDAWIDFNQNGSFDDGEQILSSVLVSQTMQTLNYDLPEGLANGDYQARVRLSSSGGLGPNGFAADGEVEDYVVQVASPPRVDRVIVNQGQSQRSSLHSVRITFDDLVDIDLTNGSPFQFTPASSNDLIATNDPVVRNEGGQTIVDLTFADGGPYGNDAGSLNDGTYQLKIDASRVTSAGAWLGGVGGSSVDPYISQPVDKFFRTYGDVDGSGNVGLNDFALFRGTFGRSAGQDGYLSELDSDGDNIIGLSDFAAFRSNFGN